LNIVSHLNILFRNGDDLYGTWIKGTREVALKAESNKIISSNCCKNKGWNSSICPDCLETELSLLIYTGRDMGQRQAATWKNTAFIPYR
jgi:hypothetical protein